MVSWFTGRYLRPHWRALLVIVLLVAAQTIGNLYIPNLNADIINNGVVKGDIGYIWRTGAVMGVIAVAIGVLAIVAAYLSARTAMAIGAELRASVFSTVQNFSMQEMDRFGAASLITRNTNDVQQIQNFLQVGLAMMIMAPITGIGGVILAINQNAKLSLLLFVVVPLMGGIIAFMLTRATPLFRALQGKIDRLNQIVREQVTGIRVIRAFLRTRYEARRFEVANADLTQNQLSVNRLFAFAIPSLMLVMNLSSVAVVWFGGHLISSGEMPVGNLTAFLSYILQILMSMMIAVMMVIFIPRAVASGARIREVENTVSTIDDPEVPETPLHLDATVEFKDVDFGYPGAERLVLQKLNFTLRPGQTSAVIGSTGAGKTTLVNLIPRFFDVTGGEVLVDGLDVRRQELDVLRSRMGLVPQRAYLFTGTIADNLRFSKPDATDEELWHALEVAQASDFVREMPGQLDAPIDQGGTNLSGGQRQRMSIARALVRRPAVYLFDDCFSALDAATDARLRSALKADTRDATVLIVAQRVSTILHADQIIVLEEGRMVGVGTHEELLRSCPEYQEIVASQLGEGQEVPA
ncbi:MAG: ABC transporter ATP-binding protein [Candidatus Dormibacteraeota bacterium]|nr:ABC transporter ATP-binding protein [Candidatus Dormibacteraeota bacterium]